jgi:riboflavin biosynthesis pyrimidine reductase
MERFARLLPDQAADLTPADLAAAVPGPAPGDRPFLLVNMIATADGRATIAGRTAPIANRADYELFHALRTRVGAVMVGAETVRVESYGPMDPPAVLVTRSARVPADVGLLKAPGNHVVVLTPSPDATLPPCAARVSYLRVPLEAGVRRLRTELGFESVLCEGGPQLLGDLLRARLVDELHLVIATKLAGGEDPITTVSGPALDPPAELALLSLHESGAYLFLRYGVKGSAT